MTWKPTHSRPLRDENLHRITFEKGEGDDVQEVEVDVWVHWRRSAAHEPYESSFSVDGWVDDDELRKYINENEDDLADFTNQFNR